MTLSTPLRISLIALFIFLGSTLWSQDHFTGTDLDGNFHDTEAYILEGKPVFLFVFSGYNADFFLLHESGYFQNLYNTIGQGGSNEVVLLYVAGGEYSDAAELDNVDFSASLGPGYSDVSWLAGHEVPVLMAYDNPEMPEYFFEYEGVQMMCPSGGTVYPNWNSNPDFLAEFNAVCCSHLKDFDPALGPVFFGDQANCNQGQAPFYLANEAGIVLEACLIDFYIDGVWQEQWAWTGSIEACDRMQLLYENPAIQPGSQLGIAIAETNEVTSNDSLSYTAPEVIETTGHIVLGFDGSPEGSDVYGIYAALHPQLGGNVFQSIGPESNYHWQFFLDEGCYALNLQFMNNITEVGGSTTVDFHLLSLSANGLIADTLLSIPAGQDLELPTLHLLVTEAAQQQVWGFVFEDPDILQTYHPSLQGIPGIQLQYGPYVTTSAADGSYSFPEFLGFGTSVEIVYDTALWPVFTTPGAGTPTGDASYMHNFGLNSDAPVVDLALNLDMGMPYFCESGIWSTAYVSNTGNQPALANFAWTFDPLLTLVDTWPQGAQVIGNEVSWSDVPVSLGGIAQFSLTFDTLAAEDLGALLSAAGTLETMDVQGGFVSSSSFAEADTLWCAYDPNDKYGFPLGSGPEGLIPAGTSLKYRIRFQNTGNFPATHVTLVDTLPAELDLSTFAMGPSSHPCEVLLNGDTRVLQFVFENIMLPDSASDPLGSIGQVYFDIEMMPGLQPGQSIENTAYIYFDLNEAIVTNTSLHTIGAPLSALASMQRDDLEAYPIPTSDVLQVMLPEGAAVWALQLSDVWGRRMLHKGPLPGGMQQLSLAPLPPGVYILQAIDMDGRSSLQRKVVRAGY